MLVWPLWFPRKLYLIISHHYTSDYSLGLYRGIFLPQNGWLDFFLRVISFCYKHSEYLRIFTIKENHIGSAVWKIHLYFRQTHTHTHKISCYFFKRMNSLVMLFKSSPNCILQITEPLGFTTFGWKY